MNLIRESPYFIKIKIFFKKWFKVRLWVFYLISKKPYRLQKKERTAQINGKNLKELLKKFKEERDRIEKETGVRPPIDETTQMFMRKILNVWIAEGKEIDEEKFWIEVDYNRQFTHPVEYYEINS